MTATLVVIACVVGWLLCAVCAIRLFDTLAGGLDEDERDFVVPLSLLLAPFALIAAVAAYPYHWLITGRTGAAALLYPGHARKERRRATAQELFDKATEYSDLARKATDTDERRLFNDVAADYERKAHELRGRRYELIDDAPLDGDEPL